MADRGDDFLLARYCRMGWLERAYFDGEKMVQPYSADDRLRAGEMWYEDFLAWKRGTHLVSNYDMIKVDCSAIANDGIRLGFSAERFRKATRLVPKSSLAVVYKIVLEEKKISPLKALSKREKLYFCDEIKGLLCRGLDALCSYYVRWL